MTAGTYSIDCYEVQRESYYLIAFLSANKELLRNTARGQSLFKLQERFLKKELTSHLLSIAAKIRVFEEYVRALPTTDKARTTFFRRLEHVNQRYAFAAFEKVSLRDACNRVIHATIFELYDQHGDEPHDMCATRFADAEHGVKPLQWNHFRTDWLRLANPREDWYLMLDVRAFASAVFDLCETFPAA